jgi:hypothetical protein
MPLHVKGNDNDNENNGTGNTQTSKAVIVSLHEKEAMTFTSKGLLLQRVLS